jgi:enamine deaminase RidA (YjgF/YER057c/UK114 family)
MLMLIMVASLALPAAARSQQEKDEPEPATSSGDAAAAMSDDMDGRAVDTESPRPEARLAALGIELPTPPPPVANYVRAVRTGNLVFLAGHGPLDPAGGYVTGKLGRDLDVEQGYAAARLTAIALLASLRAEIGSLDRVRRIVRVEGMVNSTAEFTDQSKVINGCSDLLVEIFGERGKHARAAVGMVSLPIGLAVEIHMVVEVE